VTVGIAAFALSFWSAMVAPVPRWVAIGLLGAAYCIVAAILAISRSAAQLTFPAEAFGKLA
jgi:hypothetical protein